MPDTLDIIVICPECLQTISGHLAKPECKGRPQGYIPMAQVPPSFFEEKRAEHLEKNKSA